MIEKKDLLLKIILPILILFILIIVYLSLPPKDFPINTTINVSKNSGLSNISDLLYEKHLIKSPFVFKIEAVLFGGYKRIIAGDYIFKEASNSINIARRLIKGEHGLSRIKITIPEGLTANDIAKILAKNINKFDTKSFLNLASLEEGYLFPDTYFFYENVEYKEVFDTLKKAFKTKIDSLSNEIKLSNRKTEDIVIMASIVEKEATSTEDRRKIAGILWKRIDDNFPLQVDPPLAYITSNKDGFISIADTKIDSPYNTYKYKGLPKGPISNPGLDALKATVNPISTKYYYYLSDKKGNIHYAVTYDGHLINKEKYIINK